MKLTVLLLAGMGPILSLSAYAEPFEATITTNTETGSVQYELPGTTAYKDLAWKDTVQVPVGTQVKTLAGGVAKIGIFPGGNILLLPNTSFTISSLNVGTEGDKVTKRQARVNLFDGTLKILLSHKAGNTSPIDFSVKTATCVAAARGTKYVDLVVDGVTYVEVIDGTVDVNGTLVTAGEVAEVGPDGKVKIISFKDLSDRIRRLLERAIQITDGGIPTVNASDAAGSEHAN